MINIIHQACVVDIAYINPTSQPEVVSINFFALFRMAGTPVLPGLWKESLLALAHELAPQSRVGLDLVLFKPGHFGVAD